MSVKNQKKAHARGSSRVSEVLTEPEPEVLVCSPSCIKFNKKNINFLYLQCECEQSSTNDSQKTQKDFRSSSGFEELNQVYCIQLDGSSTLHVIKNHVKHIFPFEGEGFEDKQWVKLSFQRDHKVTINSYGLIRVNKKLKLVKDSGPYKIEEEKCFTIKPLQLLEQKIKLRALKMSKSQKKQLNFSQTKKINILGDQKSPVNLSNSSFSASFSSIMQTPDIELKKSIKKANISLALCDRTNFDVKGVEFKKSVEKDNKAGRSPLRNKNEEKIAAKKASKYQNSLNTSKKHNYRKSKHEIGGQITSKSKMWSSKQNMTKSQGLKSDGTLQNDAYSSTSYYTSKKSVSSVFQFSENDPTLEANLQSHQKSFSNLAIKNPKTENKNFAKMGETKKGCFNLSTNPKSFSKNISQSKIMQVSRTLLLDKTRK